MTAKRIEGSITKTSIKKLRIHQGEYEWANARGLMINDGPTMIYLLFKNTNPATSIGVSNLRDQI